MTTIPRSINGSATTCSSWSASGRSCGFAWLPRPIRRLPKTRSSACSMKLGPVAVQVSRSTACVVRWPGNPAGRPPRRNPVRSLKPPRSITIWAGPSSARETSTEPSRSSVWLSNGGPRTSGPTSTRANARTGQALLGRLRIVQRLHRTGPPIGSQLLQSSPGRRDIRTRRRRFPRLHSCPGTRPSLNEGPPNRGTSPTRRAVLLGDQGLSRALHTASDRETLGRVHYNLALAYLARRKRSSARASAEQAVANGNNDARRLREQLGGIAEHEQRKPLTG